MLTLFASASAVELSTFAISCLSVLTLKYGILRHPLAPASAGRSHLRCRYCREELQHSPLTFVTPGSFIPPGRVMLQFLSPRLTASNNVAESTSKVGKRVIVIADLLQTGGPQSA